MTPRIWGFIISNREWGGQIQLEMGMNTFGRSAAEAWRRHIRMEGRDELDFPIFVQRWSDKGYGPIYVCVELASPLPQPPLSQDSEDERSR